jgi:hypothetical protein
MIVAKAEWLAGDLREIALLLRYFYYLNIKVVEAYSGIELTTEPYYLQFADPGDAAFLASAAKSVGAFKGRLTRLVNGSAQGRKPFGTYPTEAETMRRLLELRRELAKDSWRRRAGRVSKRLSFKAIAEILNAESKPSGCGRPWTASAVRHIISRERPHWLGVD